MKIELDETACTIQSNTPYTALISNDKIEAKVSLNYDYHNHYSIWNLESIGIPITYICTALLVSFPRAYIDYFPRLQGAGDAQLNTLLIVRELPWSFKLIFGILPDNFPVQQQRFRPYMLIGYSITSIFYFVLALYATEVSIFQFSLLLFGAMIGIVMADVMADALVTNRVLMKQESACGELQSRVYLCRFLSEMGGYWLGAFVTKQSAWGYQMTIQQVFGLLAILPLFTAMPAIMILSEPTVTCPLSWKEQMIGLWTMLKSQATWQPICFLALVNAFMLSNPAWGNYLTVNYRFSASQYGAMTAIGATVTFFSLLLYRRYILPLLDNPWHWVYYITSIVICSCSLLNLVLIFHRNEAIGISPFWFSIGDVAVLSFARGFQYLPTGLMLVSMCPEKQEGLAFALLSSITNLSQAFSQTISNLLLLIWPVDLDDLKSGETHGGVWKLTILTSIISLIPMFLTSKWLPRGKFEHDAMKSNNSTIGGTIVLVLYSFGLLWVIILSLVAVAAPCHILVGGPGC